MTSPVQVTFREIGVAPPRTPVSIVVIAPRGAGGTIETGKLAQLTATNYATLGTDGLLKTAYDRITEISSPVLYGVPYVTSNDPQTQKDNLDAAIDVIGTPETKGVLGGFGPDLVLMPNVGNGAATADEHVTRLKNLAAIDRNRLAGIFVDAIADSMANTVAWATANSGEGIFAMSNADGTVPGSIVAAAHHLAAIGGSNFGVKPYGVRYPVRASNPTPERTFAIEDGSAAAETLTDSFLTSIISYSGGHYLWGGRMQTGVVGSPMGFIGNRLVAYAITKQLARILLGYVGIDFTPSEAENAQSQGNDVVQPYIDAGELAEGRISLPALSGTVLRMGLQLFFPRVTTGVILDVEVSNTGGA